MKVYLVIEAEWESVVAAYASRVDAERHVEHGLGDLEVQDWDVWAEFSLDRFTKKGYLRAGVYDE